MAIDPAASNWSQRFEQGLNPAIERFNASIGFDINLLQQDLDGSIAHARMLGRCGVISEAEDVFWLTEEEIGRVIDCILTILK